MFCPLLPPLLRPLKYLNPNRVQMNIIMHGQRTLLGIKQDRFVSSLKQRSVPSVTPVEPDPIAGVKPMHRSREARPRPHFNLQMIVVRHQYMGVDLHAKTLRKLPQSLQKIFVTTPNPKNHLSPMPMVQPLRQQQVASLAASLLHYDFRFSRSVPASSPLSAPAPRSVIGHRAVVSGITRAVTKGWKNDDRPTSCCSATAFYLLWP